jgi:CAP12/Pycsar effector protein, TIR domain
MTATGSDLFVQINNAVIDLQASQYQTFERPLKTLARLLHHPDLEAANNTLTEGVDLQVFLESQKPRGGVVGGGLTWPEAPEQTLGLTLLLIDRFAQDPNFMLQFGHTYFYSGRKIIGDIHAVTGQMIIPFVRDYRTYVMSQGNIRPKLVKPVSNKIFIVHGHDGETREMVARFIEKIGFEAVILHERPNKGRTIITKFREEAADIGFAVVLMTPDDQGGKTGDAAGALRARARQNVVFELGFFIGVLGPERVAALVRGDIERPSDFDGVVYISLENSSWKSDLGKELQAAGYSIDWNKVMGA